MPRNRNTQDDDDEDAPTRPTKLNLKSLQLDGDFSEFEESFRAEMIMRRLAHHFPGLVDDEVATLIKQAQKSPLSNLMHTLC